MLIFEPHTFGKGWEEFGVLGDSYGEAVYLGKIEKINDNPPTFQASEQNDYYSYSLSEIQQLADFMRTLC